MRLTLAGALSQSLSTARESMWIVAPKKMGKNWVSEHLLWLLKSCLRDKGPAGHAYG